MLSFKTKWLEQIARMASALPRELCSPPSTGTKAPHSLWMVMCGHFISMGMHLSCTINPHAHYTWHDCGAVVITTWLYKHKYMNHMIRCHTHTHSAYLAGGTMSCTNMQCQAWFHTGSVCVYSDKCGESREYRVYYIGQYKGSKI